MAGNSCSPTRRWKRTDALYRFEEDLPAGKLKDLIVQEELISKQGIAILPMDTGTIETYLRTSPKSPPM